jgi:hypothetical protein
MSIRKQNIKITETVILTCAVYLLVSSCNQNNMPLYKSDTYIIWPDRVEQGQFTARADSPDHMVSDYVSMNADIDPVIQFKFSINGRDDELPFAVNHQANIYPDSGKTVVLNVVFGQQSDLRTNADATRPLPQNTRVRFRVDFNNVLKSFSEKGYYDDIRGNRIFKNDFRGLYIAGDTYPLSWDFENLAGNSQLKLEDPDGDGIYEDELVFNVYDPSAHTAAEWKLNNDIPGYPRFESGSVLLNALYNLSLDELEMLKETDGTFRTGKEWPGVWTRDISYSVILSLAYLDPERSMNSLMRKVNNDRIIQDTGTGGAWPVSTDRIVWIMAAWEIYKYTGDREWLAKAFEIAKNSVEDDRKTIVDPVTGLMRGESSFLDWRKQTYPLWMEPADIYYSNNLGTNAAYCQSLRTLGMMASELGAGDEWSDDAETLRQNINKNLWQNDKGYYGQYLYGQQYRTLSPRSEALGEAFTVLFDMADDSRKKQVLQNTPVTPFGITCIYPQIPGIPPYHNNGIWPFVQAFWNIANARNGEAEALEAGLASIIRPAALFLTNKENFVAETGDFAGTEINSDRQLWSVAGMLAMNYRVLFGMEFEKDRLSFKPVIPASFRGHYSLKNFRYRNGTYDISISGYGNGIRSFTIDGKESPGHFIAATTTGNHTIAIKMTSKVTGRKPVIVPNITAPETPVLSCDDSRLAWHPLNGAAEYSIFKNGEQFVSTRDTAVAGIDDYIEAEYQAMTLDSSGNGSFLSNPVSIVPGSLKIIAEAEDFNLKGENREKGYSGTGYVHLTLKNKEELIIKVNATAGRYVLRMRYANGTGPVNTDNNCAIRSLYVNGDYVAALVFPQRGLDEWSDWGMTNVEYTDLKDGENLLTIRYNDFNRNMDGEINELLLDYLYLQKTE